MLMLVVTIVFKQSVTNNSASKPITVNQDEEKITTVISITDLFTHC